MTETVTIAGLFSALGNTFVSSPVDHLDLTLDGIAGDRHAGSTRRTGAREPWHPRRTTIRNDRQLSILAQEELALVAEALGLDLLPADWIGGNLLVSGAARLSFLPPMTRLMAASGATVTITAYNAPCRLSGRAIAERSGNPDHELAFPKKASGLRGLVGYVERPGQLRVGDRLTVVTPRRPE